MDAGLTAPVDANPAAVIDAGGHFDAERAIGFAPPASAAIRTRVFRRLPFSAALGTCRLRHELSERSLPHHPHHACARTAIAGGDEGTGRGSRSVTRFANCQMR